MSRFKTLICVILTLCLAASMLTVNASSENQTDKKEPEIIKYDNFVTEQDIEKYRDKTMQQIEEGFKTINTIKANRSQGKSIGLRYIEDNLSVPLLRQDSGSWKNNLIPGSSYTFSQAGCGMTSYAMVFNYYGYNETPETVATKYYNEYGNPINFTSSRIVSLYNCSIEAVGSVSSASALQAAIVGGINNGYPTVLKMIKGSNTHFIVARGYSQATGSDPIIINIRDPESDINYSRLNSYYENGWQATHFVTVGS